MWGRSAIFSNSFCMLLALGACQKPNDQPSPMASDVAVNQSSGAAVPAALPQASPLPTPEPKNPLLGTWMEIYPSYYGFDDNVIQFSND